MSGANGDSLLLLPAIQGMVSLMKKYSKKLVSLSFSILHASKMQFYFLIKCIQSFWIIAY